MLTRHRFGDVTWIDYSSPTTDELSLLKDELGLDPLVAEHIAEPNLRQKVISFGNATFLTLYIPTKVAGKLTSECEVDFVIAPNLLITSRFNEVDSILEFSRKIEMLETLHKHSLHNSSLRLFFYLLEHIYTRIHEQFRSNEQQLKRIEDSIFAGREKEVVTELSHVSREILAYKKALSFHDDVLEALNTPLQAIDGEHSKKRIASAIRTHNKLFDEVLAGHELLVELRATNDSLLEHKQNTAVQILTFVTVATSLASLIGVIFTMPFAHVPLLEHPYGFWIVLLCMSCLVLFCFEIFKRKRWL